MENWFESDLCKSRQHCKNCRVSTDFRKWIFQKYSGPDSTEFACPFGVTGKAVTEEFPPLMEEARNAAKALGRVANRLLHGEKLKVSPEERARRLKICKSNLCKKFKNGRCLVCGCVATWKTALESEDCPLHKWDKENFKSGPSLTHGWQARAMVLSTIAKYHGPQLKEACNRHKVLLEVTAGFGGSYGSMFKKDTNIITWGVKVATWWYRKNKANVLFLENGLLAQRHGIWVDARGWFSESNLCKNKHYEDAYTLEDIKIIKQIIKKHFNWNLFQGGNPDGPIMYVLQSVKDAPCRFHFPARDKAEFSKESATLVGLKLLYKHAPDRKVIIRPHPRFREQWTDHTEAYKPYMRPDWTVDLSSNVYETLKTCSAIIGINSTTLTEALALGIPVASFGESAYTGSQTILECARDPKRLKYLYEWQPDKEKVLKYLSSIVRDHELRFSCGVDTIYKNREFTEWIARKK